MKNNEKELMKKLKNSVKNTLTESDLNTKSVFTKQPLPKYELWEGILLSILSDDYLISWKSQIKDMMNNHFFSKHNRSRMRTDKLIPIYEQVSVSEMDLEAEGTVSDPQFTEILNSIEKTSNISTHLVLITDPDTDHVRYVWGLKYNTLFIESGFNLKKD